ncbi:pyridoxal phosphate-dependent aminotransferase [Nannocystis radixulma]|uniref:Aminotransferase n=1 Tax=Nannocystis radixulma TaxID=2995305 RepID=A0ABT5AZS4_9BACT|nr:pyridoxal phosphate-dependent aminotransferase [Nannocystis radixulma]MDC0666794.1 pyridoxal phosphate-dependent aminotransferase [Nannocystis radixulma]
MLSESPTLAMSARAKELKAQGKAVLDFSAGEPDFRPPAAVTAAVTEYLQTKPVHYAPVPGMPALRDAAAAEFARYHGRAVTRGEVLVSCGAKHSLANLFMVTLSPGDEVVIPAPYWVSYADMVRLGDGVPVIVPTRREDGWRLQPDALAAALTERTRFIILGNPTNPTGAGYPAGLLRQLGEVMARVAPQCWLLVDDIYRRLVYGGFEHVSAFATLADVTDQIVIADGVSKSYSMTGYRIGFLLAPANVVAAASRLQGHVTSGAATPSQIAALAALTDPSCEAAVQDMHAAFTRRREFMLAGLQALPGLDVVAPDGAFYLFCDVSRHLGPGTQFADDIAFATWLLEQKLIGSVPGTAFGAPGHLRLSYAAADETLRDGLQRLGEAFAALPPPRNA